MQQTCNVRSRSCSRSEHMKRPYKRAVTAGHLMPAWWHRCSRHSSCLLRWRSPRSSSWCPGMPEIGAGNLCTHPRPVSMHAQCPKRLQLCLWLTPHRHEQLEAAQASSVLQGTAGMPSAASWNL